MGSNYPPGDGSSRHERGAPGTADGPRESPDPPGAAFHHRFRQLRKRLAGKQLSLAQSGLMCSEAAISLWESGRRIPSGTMFRRIARVFETLGATQQDIRSLRASWMSAILNVDDEHG